MKFEYEKNTDDRECVAFIDDEGDLILRRDSIYAVWLDSSAGKVYDFGEFDDKNANHRFYPGDTITITF